MFILIIIILLTSPFWFPLIAMGAFALIVGAIAWPVGVIRMCIDSIVFILGKFGLIKVSNNKIQRDITQAINEGAFIYIAVIFCIVVFIGSMLEPSASLITVSGWTSLIIISITVLLYPFSYLDDKCEKAVK